LTRHPRILRIVPVVLVLAVGVVAGWLAGGGGKSAQAAEPVEFTPAASVEADAFTPPADIRGLVTIKAEGSFGGTGSNFVCDRERLISFLVEKPDRLAAWARVEAIKPTPEGVTDYIRALRPATLLRPTRVTNHTFVDGEAVASQAILAAGTAVLVDENGAIRARCRTGAPLLDPVLATDQKCRDCPAGYKLPNSLQVASTYYAIHPAPPRVKVTTVKQPAEPTKPVTVTIVKQLPPNYVVRDRTKTKTVRSPANPPVTVTVHKTRIRTRTVTVKAPAEVRTVTVNQTLPPRTVTTYRTVTVYEGAG
jgi:hypothetical protein